MRNQMLQYLSADLLFAVIAYIIGTITPGPSNFAITHIAVQHGRKFAVVFAGGIVLGSFCWGILAASGLGALLQTYHHALSLLKIFAGGYFIYLGYKLVLSTIHTPLNKTSNSPPSVVLVPRAGIRLFISAYMFHMINPKALAVWLSIIAIALPIGNTDTPTYLPVALCLPFAITIFFGNALLFSKHSVVEKYLVYYSLINRVAAAMFIIIGGKLLFE